MKSAASCFKIPMSVVREDLRRYKAIPILALLGYIIFAIVPLVLSFKLYDDSAEFYTLYSLVSDLMSNHSFTTIINTLWFPVVTGVLVFSYMQKKGSSVSVHAQPFTRGQLFRGHALSSIIMIFIPVILCGIILLAISKPIFVTENGTAFATSEMAASLKLSQADIDSAQNIFSASAILKWTTGNLIQVFYVFAITAFAGMITGTAVHHFIAACGFNIIAPLMMQLINMYERKYYFGMVNITNSSKADLCAPTMYLINIGSMSLKAALVYIAIAIIILAASLYLYRIRSLERATEGVVFRPVGIAITLLFAFLGMSFTNLILSGLFDDGSIAMEIISYVAGALIGIVIARMIVAKSLRIIDKDFIKSVVIYAVLAGIFFAILGFDLFGVEKKVPELDQFDDAYVQGDFLTGYNTVLNKCEFSDDESKSAVVAFQKEIISNKDELNSADAENSEGFYISISYYKNKGKDAEENKVILGRQYYIPASYLLESDAYKKLMETDSYKKTNEKYYEELSKNRKSATIYPSGIPGADDEQVTLTAEQTAEFLEIYCKEMKSYSSEEMLNRVLEHELVSIEFYGSADFINSQEPLINGDEYCLTQSVVSTDVESVKWLRENGILDEMENKGIASCEYAVISPLSAAEENQQQPSYVSEGTSAEKNDENIFIVDKETMKKAYLMMRPYLPQLKTVEEMKDSDDYYFISFKESSSENDEGDYCYCSTAFISKEDVESLCSQG